ncbi:MAG: type II toxin-antitoxin system RelE/ParE family toxin [Planctomycetaceae bacterium]|nr:type II toxin-antitoxin system RelE/ParE family toxin [Planctomycetaceae bacterium]
MHVEFHPAAEKELNEAIDYYNQQAPGLGFEFAWESRQTVDRILTNPLAWPLLGHRTRRCRITHFPYGIIYHIHPQHVKVLAVMHLHRKPGYWHGRK